MLTYFFTFLAEHFSAFHVFSYTTTRALFAGLTSLLFGVLWGGKFIRSLQSRNINQQIRDDGPTSHKNNKKNIPTMGGVLILITFWVSSLLWCNLANPLVWLVLAASCGFAFIGWLDDTLKVELQNPKGLAGRYKLLGQVVWSVLMLLAFWHIAKDLSPHYTTLFFPLFKEITIPLSLFALLCIGTFIMVGSSNATNLTDGLDGLLILPTVIVAIVLGIYAYVSGHFYLARYLQLPFLPGSNDLLIICVALAGAGLSFLWFNFYPANIFMGDVGSLAIGGTLGMVALIIRQEVVFFIASGVMVAETVSVILQVGSYKLRKKRIFRMAPLHHHYELQGISEPKIIVRFWIISIIFALIALSLLKIR